MKKVLILSYYAPPCNLTSAQRIGSWGKYLPDNGFYPIIITRNWTGEELTEKARLQKSGNQIRIEKNERGEIHYLPYKSSLRDYFFNKSEKLIFRLLSKSFSLAQVFLRNFSIKTIPYSNLYDHVRELLKNDSSIEYLIISVDPFEQLHFGYLLKKEFPNLKWLADYRDDWTTSDIDFHSFRKLQAFFEKKWVGTSTAIISVSPYYTDKISLFTNRPGHTIYNGFDKTLDLSKKTNTDGFLITYNGSLYETQPIEKFIRGFIKFVEHNPNKNIHLHFPGLANSREQKNRVEKLLSDHKESYTITDRLPKENVIDLQLKSDLLLMVAHQNIKGIPSSKVFEYIGLRKEFIVCPGDDDVLDFIAKSSSLGIVLNNEEEVFSFLQEKYKEKLSNKILELNIDAINKFSVEKQVEKLAIVLSNLS